MTSRQRRDQTDRLRAVKRIKDNKPIRNKQIKAAKNRRTKTPHKSASVYHLKFVCF